MTAVFGPRRLDGAEPRPRSFRLTRWRPSILVACDDHSQWWRAAPSGSVISVLGGRARPPNNLRELQPDHARRGRRKRNSVGRCARSAGVAAGGGHGRMLGISPRDSRRLAGPHRPHVL